jgi:hypothetical protein
VTAMMLAADRIAANVMVANPSWVTRSIENTSAFRKSGSGRMAHPKRRKHKRRTTRLNRCRVVWWQ